MAKYKEATVKLTNTQLNKLKSAARNKAGIILRLNKKNFEDKELPHELFLAARQTAKIRNAFAKNISTDIKLNKVQISKIIQSGGSFGFWLNNLRKKALTNIAIPLARDNLPGFVSNLTSSAISKFGRKIHPLNNIEITTYFNYKSRLNDFFSRNNLPRIKDG